MSDLADQYTDDGRLNRGFLVPPGTTFSSAGQPVSPSLLNQSPEQLAAVARSMAEIKNNPHAFDIGGGLAAPTPIAPAIPRSEGSLAAPQLGDPNNPLIQVGMQAAQQYGVPWDIYYHTIGGESSWNPHIGASSAGARGIAQFIPSTAKAYGVDVSDPTSSLYGAARYLADLKKRGGSWTGALTGYLTGDPTRSPPQDVLRGNPSYARAFQLAGMQDSLIDPRVQLSAETGPMGGGVVGEPLELGTLKERARIDPFQDPVRAAASAAVPTEGPALTSQDVQRGMAQALQGQSPAGLGSGDAWQRLMTFSMMSQLMGAGTHKFVPISYDPWKIVPQMGGHIPEPVPNTGMYL